MKNIRPIVLCAVDIFTIGYSEIQIKFLCCFERSVYVPFVDTGKFNVFVACCDMCDNS